MNDISSCGFQIEFLKNNCRILDSFKNCLLSIVKGPDNLYSISIEQIKDLSNPLDSDSSNNNHDLEFLNSDNQNTELNDVTKKTSSKDNVL